MRPSLVLLPGMDGSGTLFADFVAHLEPQVDATVVSYPPDRALSYEDLGRLARESLPADRPYFLLGESFSGPIALAIAASPPGRLAGLILACTFARPPVSIAGWLHPLLSLAPVWLAPAGLMRTMLFQAGAPPGLAQRLSDALAPVRPAVWRSRLRAVLGADARRQLGAVAVPTLCLRARRDRVVPRSASQALCAGIPGVKLVELDGPHFLLQTRSREAAACVSEFIGSVTGTHPRNQAAPA